MLSVPRRRPMDETQETLRTSAFPSTHVKDKCVYGLWLCLLFFCEFAFVLAQLKPRTPKNISLNFAADDPASLKEVKRVLLKEEAKKCDDAARSRSVLKVSVSHHYTSASVCNQACFAICQFGYLWGHKTCVTTSSCIEVCAVQGCPPRASPACAAPVNAWLRVS